MCVEKTCAHMWHHDEKMKSIPILGDGCQSINGDFHTLGWMAINIHKSYTVQCFDPSTYNRHTIYDHMEVLTMEDPQVTIVASILSPIGLV